MTAPQPKRVGLVGAFYDFLDRGEMRMQRCTDCASWRHLPRYLCPVCHGDRWSWEPVSGQGEVFSWTTTMRPLHPAFATTPLTLATVALTEGPRLIAPLVGADADGVRRGMAVRLELAPGDDGHAMPHFTPQ